MNAVESYPSMRPVFSRPVPTLIDANGPAVATPAADMLKNDFQNAIHRNLQSWVQWRTQLNGNLVDTVLTGRRMAEMEPIAACLDREAPHPGHPTNNPKTLLTFSASANSSTPLQTDEFYKYGIPRARITPQLHQHRHLADDDRDVGNSIPLSTSSAPELVGKRHHPIGRCWIIIATLQNWTFFLFSQCLYCFSAETSPISPMSRFPSNFLNLSDMKVISRSVAMSHTVENCYTRTKLAYVLKKRFKLNPIGRNSAMNFEKMVSIHWAVFFRQVALRGNHYRLPLWASLKLTIIVNVNIVNVLTGSVPEFCLNQTKQNAWE